MWFVIPMVSDEQKNSFSLRKLLVYQKSTYMQLVNQGVNKGASSACDMGVSE